ncbi:hypothetical protein [Pedobacter sp.]|uniref:hypothetical protein n=1 Tax=Pedobacter sp. TaxID=1411316 RepID=UPI0031D31B51
MKKLIQFSLWCGLIVGTHTVKAQVSIKENGISIAPGTKISSQDKEAVNNILKQYDASLYQIRNYDASGKMTSKKGNLARIQITDKISSDLVNGKANMVAADMTVQAILDNATDPTRDIQVFNSMPATEKTRQRLISQLKVVLSKYQ